MSPRALWWNIPGLFLVITICTLDGMVIFATYANCDLKVQGKITFGDQVKVLYICRPRSKIQGLLTKSEIKMSGHYSQVHKHTKKTQQSFRHPDRASFVNALQYYLS